MQKQAALLMLVLGLGIGAALAVPAISVNDQTKISQLIGQLGSANFRERDAATKELDAIGEPALDALRKATKNTDMEIASRSAILVAKIEQRGENSRLLAPTYVELTCKDTPVEQAVADLAKQSGYKIVIGGDKSKLASRKVTFETGKVPFWKAFDMLCEKADLVEGDATVASNIDVPQPQPVPQPIRPLPPVQVQPLPAPAPPVPAPINKKIKIQPPIEKDAPKPNVPQGFSAEAPIQKEKAPATPAPAPAQPAQAQPIQIELQVQAQPVQVQLPAQGAVIRPRPIPQPAANNGTIVLMDGKANPSAAHVEGAIRIRANTDANLRANYGAVPQGEIGLLLEVKAEPKIQVQQVLGVKIDRAVDNYDQNLDQSMASNNIDPQVDDPKQRLKQLQFQARPAIAIAQPFPGPAQAGPTFVPASLKKGDKETKSIKELRGTVSLKIRTPLEPIITIDNILNAKGESAKGKGEASLKIIDVKKEVNGDIKVEVELQHSFEIQAQGGNVMGGPQGIVIQGNVQIQIGGGGGVGGPVFINNGGGGANLGLELLDANGAALKTMQTQQVKMQWQQNGRTIGAIVTFRPEKKDQEAAKLVFKATRLAAVDVPFVLKDVVVK